MMKLLWQRSSIIIMIESSTLGKLHTFQNLQEPCTGWKSEKVRPLLIFEIST